MEFKGGRILLRSMGFLRKYWKMVILAYVCLFFAQGFALAIPYLLKEVIDTGLAKGEQGFLILAALSIIAASALRGLFAYGQTYLGEYISQKVAYDMRNALYDRFQRLSFSFHDTAQTGQLMSRATADVEAVRMLVAMGSLRSIQFLVMFLATCTILVSLNWSLALLTFAALPFVAYRAILVSGRLRPMWLKVQEQIAALGTILQENLSGIRVVKAFAQEDYESAKFSSKANELYATSYYTGQQQAFNSPLMTFILAVVTGVILWYGGREVIEGRLSLGGLVGFNLYLANLAMPVRTLGFMVNTVSRAISAGERIFEILDAESAVKEKSDAVALNEIQGHVRFENVSFGYNSVSPILRRVDLEAKPGEMVALLGATGSGKSTVVNLIPRFYDVTSGRITVDGIDVRDVILASLRSHVGTVQQDVFLFTATIRDNIAYGAPDATMEQIVEAAKVARIHDFIISLPDGYDTWVGERGITLSGGQKQRVAIARTLLMNPRILILDDSTSSVDTETEYLIQQALQSLMKGRTTFVIAQRLRTVKNADQILVLQDGEIVERGRHEDLLAEGGIYRQIYDLQLRDQEESLDKVTVSDRVRPLGHG